MDPLFLRDVENNSDPKSPYQKMIEQTKAMGAPISQTFDGAGGKRLAERGYIMTKMDGEER